MNCVRCMFVDVNPLLCHNQPFIDFLSTSFDTRQRPDMVILAAIKRDTQDWVWGRVRLQAPLVLSDDITPQFEPLYR